MTDGKERESETGFIIYYYFFRPSVDVSPWLLLLDTFHRVFISHVPYSSAIVVVVSIIRSSKRYT